MKKTESDEQKSQKSKSQRIQYITVLNLGLS